MIDPDKKHPLAEQGPQIIRPSKHGGRKYKREDGGKKKFPPVPNLQTPQDPNLKRRKVEQKEKSLKHLVTEPSMDENQLEEEENINLKDISMGTRTSSSSAYLRKQFPGIYTGQFMRIGSEWYTPITGATLHFSLPNQYLCSCGSSTREILILNTNSTSLIMHCQKIQKALEEMEEKECPLSEFAILACVKDYVRKKIFTTPIDQTLINVEKKIEIKRADRHSTITTSTGVDIPVMTLEDFIPDGVCRHHALAICFILDWLSKQPKESRKIDGLTQHIRSNVTGGAHAWGVFTSKVDQESSHTMHIDSLWNVMDELNPKGVELLSYSGYGVSIQKEWKRTEETRALVLGKPFEPRRVSQKESVYKEEELSPVKEANKARQQVESENYDVMPEFFELNDKPGLYTINSEGNNFSITYIDAGKQVKQAKMEFLLNGSIVDSEGRKYIDFRDIRKALNLRKSAKECEKDAIRGLNIVKEISDVDHLIERYDYIVHESEGKKTIFFKKEGNKVSMEFEILSGGLIKSENKIYKDFEEFAGTFIPCYQAIKFIKANTTTPLYVDKILETKIYTFIKAHGSYILYFKEDNEIRAIPFDVLNEGHIKSEERQYENLKAFIDAHVPHQSRESRLS